ncbi:unnamed protein product [Coccothraustes coccothraustes]
MLRERSGDAPERRTEPRFPLPGGAREKELGPPVPAAEDPRVPSAEDPGRRRRVPGSPGPWEKAEGPWIPGSLVRRDLGSSVQRVPGEGAGSLNPGIPGAESPGEKAPGSPSPLCGGSRDKAPCPRVRGAEDPRVPGAEGARRRHRAPAADGPRVFADSVPRVPGEAAGSLDLRADSGSPGPPVSGVKGPGRRRRVPRCRGARRRRQARGFPVRRLPGGAAVQNGHGRAAGRQRRCGFVPRLRDAPVALPGTQHLPPACPHPPSAGIKAFAGLHREFGMVPCGSRLPARSRSRVFRLMAEAPAVRKNTGDRKVSFLLSLSLFY